LYTKLVEGMQDVAQERVEPFDTAMADIRKELAI
jgi:hypothetical protein